MAKLDNQKHETFCVLYIKYGNAAKAYLDAGYSTQNAAQNASRLLTNANVLARIDELRAEKSAQLHADLDRVLGEHVAIMDFDLTRIIDNQDGQWFVKPIDEWPPEYRKLASFGGISRNGQPIIKIDKHAARESISKLLGLFTNYDQLVKTAESYGKKLVDADAP